MGAPITNALGRKRREGKVRPLQGNSPHDRPVSRGTISSLRRICDDPFRATPFPLQRTILRRPVCVFQVWRNLSGPMWFQNQNQTPGRRPGIRRRPKLEATFREIAHGPSTRLYRMLVKGLQHLQKRSVRP